MSDTDRHLLPEVPNRTKIQIVRNQTNYREVLCVTYNSDMPVTQRLICEATHLSKTTVHAIIAGFVKQGYVELQEMADDRRQKSICFTDSGYVYAKPIMEHMSLREILAFEMLDDATIQAMIAGIEEYKTNFNAKLNHTRT